MFRTVFSKGARRRLERMPANTAKTIKAKIDALAMDPFAPDNNASQLQGGGYRLRVGDWRVLYRLDAKTRTLMVGLIEPRGSAYR